jgi:HEAT repeat protein
VSLNSSKRIGALPAASWVLAALLLNGCFLHTDVPIAPSDPAAALDDHSEKPQGKSKVKPVKKTPDEAESLRELARQVDAADDPQFTEAAQSPSAVVRIEALRAWAASKKGPVPQIVVDMRSDDDPRVRAEAMAMLAARKYPDALDYLCAALHDVSLPVRQAAVRGLGELDNETARATLSGLLKDKAELVRAEAVSAIAAHGSQSAVLIAARDPSWRVRLKVAQALAKFSNTDGAAAARRMLNDPSPEVERQVIRSLASWPIEAAVPVLLDALARDAVSVRKLAAEQLTARWPGPSGAFPYEAPPARRSEALAELRARCQREFSMADSTARTAGFNHNVEAKALESRSELDDGHIERLISGADFAALNALGPDVVAALERVAIDRALTLPEPVYRDVLPHYSPAFAALDRLNGGDTNTRRQAANDFVATARNHPPSRLETARLCALMTTETDPVVWFRALEAIENETSEPAVRMARLALNQSAGEVRRKACEFLAGHPDSANETFLLPLLKDPQQAVVLAATRALGVAGTMRNSAALKTELASSSEEVQLAAAFALARLNDPAGEDSIERLSYSHDIRIRGQLAQGLGELGEKRFTGVLIRLLDDSKATVSHAALASLPKATGRDVSQSANDITISTSEQIGRWKKWWADESKH